MEADIEWLHSEVEHWQKAILILMVAFSGITWAWIIKFLETKVNLGKWEDSHECILMQALKFCLEAKVLS